jgi:hypothetical protein
MHMESNAHERDKRISFDSATHIYHVDGVECYTSATGLVGKFFSKFDADKTIAQYYDNWQRKSHPEYGGKTKKEIKIAWEQKSRNSAELGARLHEAIEMHYRGGSPDIEGIEEDYARFLSFREEHPHLNPYRIEWRIGTDPDVGIAGTIDMCFTAEGDPEGSVHLYDWKRTEKDIVATGFRGQTGLGPLAHLPDANYFHYSMQLNTYKYILQTYYSLEVASMHFVTLHSSKLTYNKHEARDLQKEVQSMLQIVKAERVGFVC